VDLEQAIDLARRAHSGQTDKAGRPYIKHVLRVLDSVNTEDERIAAALHDVAEDTELTLDDRRNRHSAAWTAKKGHCPHHSGARNCLLATRLLRRRGSDDLKIGP